jgi:hypothetical protein
MVAPIFRFRNVKIRIVDNNPTFVYGVNTFNSALADRTLDQGISPAEVSTVVLTVQISNTSGFASPSPAPPAPVPVNVSVFTQNSSLSPPAFDDNNARVLVFNYPLITNNAFDPLNGNLVLASNDQLWVQIDQALACDVVLSLLEIANATAS